MGRGGFKHTALTGEGSSSAYLIIWRCTLENIAAGVRCRWLIDYTATPLAIPSHFSASRVRIRKPYQANDSKLQLIL